MDFCSFKLIMLTFACTILLESITIFKIWTGYMTSSMHNTVQSSANWSCVTTIAMISLLTKNCMLVKSHTNHIINIHFCILQCRTYRFSHCTCTMQEKAWQKCACLGFNNICKFPPFQWTMIILITNSITNLPVEMQHPFYSVPLECVFDK